MNDQLAFERKTNIEKDKIMGAEKDAAKRVAVTFLIGNGFDLALGLKTGYCDFLTWYKEKKTNNPATPKAVKWLVDRIQPDSDLWADAEAAWGKLLYSEARKDDPALTPQKIIDEAISDFQHELVDYLKNQMNRIQIGTADHDEVRKRFLQALVRSLRLVDMDRDLQNALDSGCGLDIRLVTFNITDTLERFLGEHSPTEEIPVPDKNGKTIPVRIVSICHVHGSIAIQGSMIFGLDNPDQISDAKARDYCRKTSALIKPETDRRLLFGYEQAGKDAINHGTWIVCFGLSLGTTDRLWWEYLYGRIALLRKKVRIVLHPYFPKFSTCFHAQDKLRITNEQQERFFEAAGTPNPSSRVRDCVFVAKHYPHTDFDGNDNGYCDPLCLGWFKKNYTLGADDEETLTENFVAAEKGDAKAQYNLGVRYDFAFGVAKNERTAVEWYQKAADKGVPEAMFSIALCYANGEGVEKDERKAVEWYQKAAEKGIEKAMNNLGLCYKHGRGVEKDERKAVEWCQKAAEKGNVEAMFNLGVCYSDGTGAAKDERKAVEWWQKAADEGFAAAMFNLGNCYCNGSGVAKDERKAVEWYQKAADKGLAAAMFNLGNCYANGTGVEKDERKTVYWWQKAADKDLAEAMYNLGNCYYNGTGVAKEASKAVEWYQKVADLGHAGAMLNLALCYENGTGVAKDESKAVEWYQKVADKDLAEAMFNLALCYRNGTGVAKDERKAVEWYQKAADKGLAAAMFNLGVCYANGEGVEKDERKAVEWCQKAAEKGDANAMCGLGMCYRNGDGVAKDAYKAVEWHQKAAEKGNEMAMFNLALCYDNGTGVEKDERKAAEWYRKAAEKGHAGAMFNLGVCYYDGRGVTKSLDEAEKWFRKAVEAGEESAKKALEAVLREKKR